MDSKVVHVNHWKYFKKYNGDIKIDKNLLLFILNRLLFVWAKDESLILKFYLMYGGLNNKKTLDNNYLTTVVYQICCKWLSDIIMILRTTLTTVCNKK
jgi:hypothetical protein